MEVTKAVSPAAGFGTLPPSHEIPAEGDDSNTGQAHSQSVVEDAIEAGIDDVLTITGRGKQSIERYFDKS